MTARLDVGAYVVLGLGVPVSEGLEDVLCRVVRVQDDLRDIRRVGLSSGELEGIEVRFLASELRPASPAALRWHDALRVRAALAVWRQAAEDDDEDVDSLASLVEAAEQLAERVIHADPAELSELAVCGYVSDRDGAQLVEIDTTEDTGRVRVLIGEGVIYDGDPNTDEPPGRHYGTRWGSSGEHCDECGAQTTELVSEQHEQSCSLYPPAEVPDPSPSGPVDIADIAARIDPDKARLAVARMCAALGAELDWGSDTLEAIAEAVTPAAPNGFPSFTDQDDDAIEFWQNVTG